MTRTLLCLLACAILSPARSDDSGPFHFEFEQLAPGVWAGVRPDPSRSPVMGNTTFVIGDDGVVVFDGGGAPRMSEQVIDKIRSLTNLPVTHVVISHWHGDHSFGIYRFAQEFPGVEIVSHRFTGDMFDTPRMAYLDRQQDFRGTIVPQLRSIIEARAMPDGRELSDAAVARYARILEDADLIEAEAQRSRITPPTITFTGRYVIDSGSRHIELLFLGPGNTEGDIVMWLPEERIVATGDMVVLPSPYAFNMPPRPWAAALRRLEALDFATLVPGHGDVQRDTDYLDLLIATAEDIAGQRDALLADGVPRDQIAEQLDFSAIEPRFTGGDPYREASYEAWFEQPFRLAAVKALGDEPMVPLAPLEAVPFDDERWTFGAAEHERVEHLGRPALRLKGGAAVLKDLDVRNAIVEFDMAVTPERGFAGLRFRVRDRGNYEHFYLRPHQSGKPDANQYTPVFNGVSAWQLYHGAAYSAPTTYRFDDWMHVRIVYAGDRAEVFIDSDEPVLRIDGLRRDVHGGSIGLDSADFSAVHYADFRYAPLSVAYAFPWPQPERPTTPGMITQWQVSDAFDGASLDTVTRMDAALTSERTWSVLAAEPSGITNLAQNSFLGQGKDTVFARTFLHADVGEIKHLQLGYSDRATVFVNGRRVYSGDNTYLSRDERYLGTIGLFDSVVLPLEAGDNELCIAVSEAFGGWGIMGRISSTAFD